jgi:glycosyltransferase involved in cell wall biosynthesis
MARIRIYIARHLCTAPRVQKEADALASAGHRVSVHGVAYRADFSSRDTALSAGRAWRWEPAADFTRRSSALAWAWTRLLHARAKQRYTQTGRVDADVWSYANRHLRSHALTNPADLTLVHAEGSLWFARELQQCGHRVGVDFEDWFSRDLSPEQRKGRPVELLDHLEKHLLTTTPYALATSGAMASAMSEAFDAPPPAVIYNTFPENTPPPAPALASGRAVRLHWFSLVVGPERGLEPLFSALPLVKGDWELHLRGDAQPGYKETLLALVPPVIHGRIHFHPTVPSARLPVLIAEHDIGLALDVSSIPSRNLTITNKLFQYLQAGLAVLASDTAGHREIFNRAPECGSVFPGGDSSVIAATLNRWIAHPPSLLQARLAARNAYVEHFSHERQQHRYAELAARALAL